MENTKISESFDIREVVHPHIYNHPAIGVRCIDFIHPEAGNTLEAIKLATGDVITINDWLWKGIDNAQYVDSGLRLPGESPYALFSSHRFGCGFDLKFKNMTAQEAYDFILKNQHLFPHITRMESDNYTIKGRKTPWIHIEIGAARASGVEIDVFNP